MATIKFYLRKKVLSDGTSPLVLKILKDGKASISHIGVSLKHEDWDIKKRRVRKTHPNATKLNNYLLKKLSEANNTAIDLQTLNSSVSSKAVIKKIKPNSGISFQKYATAYISTLKASGKYVERNSAANSLTHFMNFLGGSDINFPDITALLLERYKIYLSNEVKVNKEGKNMAPTTVLNNLAFIRRIFNLAIEAKDIENKYYPFDKNGIELKSPETEKIGLSVDDVTAIENVELSNPRHNHARNLWLISFYFGGMRASDVLHLKWSDFRDDRLHYKMRKNGKPGSLKTPEKVDYILAQYEDEKRHADDFIFPELKTFPHRLNKYELKKFLCIKVSEISTLLKVHVAPKTGITGKLTMHIARHTFGNIAGQMNISLVRLQKIFRHSSILTTMNYMKAFMNSETDDALDAVLGSTNDNVRQLPKKTGIGRA